MVASLYSLDSEVVAEAIDQVLFCWCRRNHFASFVERLPPSNPSRLAWLGVDGVGQRARVAGFSAESHRRPASMAVA